MQGTAWTNHARRLVVNGHGLRRFNSLCPLKKNFTSKTDDFTIRGGEPDLEAQWKAARIELFPNKFESFELVVPYLIH
jgi:hypothetical protein